MPSSAVVGPSGPDREVLGPAACSAVALAPRLDAPDPVHRGERDRGPGPRARGPARPRPPRPRPSLGRPPVGAGYAGARCPEQHLVAGAARVVDVEQEGRRLIVLRLD